MEQIKIGNFIAKCRKDKKLTQEQLAEKLHISVNAVSKWERGLNLPDYSNMQPLCDILGISLNEFFAGEHIKENEIKQQSEKNILDVLNFVHRNNKKYKISVIIIIILISILLCIIGRYILVKCGYIIDDNLKYSQIYIIGENNNKGSVDINKFGRINIDFDIGANKYGEAVFKNPNKAFKTLKKEYSKGIKLIQREFNLLPLSNFNYKSYRIYGWQATTGTEEEVEQARFVSAFMDIYENSFNI